MEWIMLPRPCGWCGGAVLRDDGKGWGVPVRWVCANCGADSIGRREPTPAESKAAGAESKKAGDGIHWAVLEAEAARDLAAVDAGATLRELGLSEKIWERRRAALLNGGNGNGYHANGNGNGNGHKAAEGLIPAWMGATAVDGAAPIYGQLAMFAD